MPAVVPVRFPATGVLRYRRRRVRSARVVHLGFFRREREIVEVLEREIEAVSREKERDILGLCWVGQRNLGFCN